MLIRARAKAIAEAFPPFSSLRVKLHGQPDAGDIHLVKEFRARERQKIPAHVDKMIQELIQVLELAFQPSHYKALKVYLQKLPAKSAIRERLLHVIGTYAEGEKVLGEDRRPVESKSEELSMLLWSIRKKLLEIKDPKTKLMLLDLSNDLESIFFFETGTWQPGTIAGLLRKGYTLAKALAGCGYLEIWEWECVDQLLQPAWEDGEVPLAEIIVKADYARRVVEWGSGMVRAAYDPIVTMYARFEPLATGFLDDRIRSSPLLPMGRVVNQLADFTARRTGLASEVMGIRDQSRIRGLNPGLALGELTVIPQRGERLTFSSDKIYALPDAHADLQPVAGIATVSEGNLVSHVQLLARSLGIPNAVISEQNLKDLAEFSGQRVFYAVSPGGVVIMKPGSEMTAGERTLVEGRRRAEEKFVVPGDKFDLGERSLISLKILRASDSGRLCGPKAANLGQLKSLFPDKVVDGLVIPFGVFRRHLEQQMPATSSSFWEYLQATFALAERQRGAGKTEDEIEKETLKRLSGLREAITEMSLLTGFREQLREAFKKEFGVTISGLPVFIRSDTNMEDLKEFTGAGLNLTVFNVLEEEKIHQAIRDVWASPYTERSYRWRQKYLANPENVFPSILILPSVNVDKSGVMITTGITTSDPDDTTIAFSRGAGGAVEGQAAESYLLKRDGQCELLSPSRETTYTILPAEGGTPRVGAAFDRRILDLTELKKLSELAAEIRRRIPGTAGIESPGPFDVELGFRQDRIWLFQVRPYVENRRAGSSLYLRGLDPVVPKDIRISLDEGIARVD